MVATKVNLPHTQDRIFLTYTGMETDLIFTQGIDLPGFASFPLLETEAGRARLESYYRALIDLGRKTATGVVLESVTWVANRDRGAAIGYAPAVLRAANIDAIALMAKLRDEAKDVPVVLSANIGPRADAYTPDTQMSAAEAERYHREQMAHLAKTQVDLISGYTLAYTAEAIGIVRAAKAFALPVAISFTVETDGRLPTGTSLSAAIKEVDAATDGYASYFMINCAHPDHFTSILAEAAVGGRLKGIVANASRCSHAELDAAPELDAGDPEELGRQLGLIRRRHPQFMVFGGCCGTDMRHMARIAENVRAE